MIETIANRNNPDAPQGQDQKPASQKPVQLDPDTEAKIAKLSGERLKGPFQPSK